MRVSKFSEAQKAFVLRQAVDVVLVAEVCRKAGISQARVLIFKNKYGGMLPNEMRRLKQLENENRRELFDRVGHEWNQSIRRVCEVLSVDRSTYHYQFKRADQAGLKKRIKEICETRVRYWPEPLKLLHFLVESDRDRKDL